jgi:putative hydrolase of HD superfamily
MNDIEKIIDFLQYSEGLKRELRHSWLSDGKQESVAEHSWRMALAAMLVMPKIKTTLNSDKVLKMCLIHDLVEIDASDVPAIMHIGNSELTKQKAKKELEAIKNIQKALPADIGSDFYQLWVEFEEQKTNESKFVKLLDKLEARTQKALQPEAKFVEREKDIHFINQYKKIMDDLCLGDEFLINLNEIVHKKRLTAVKKK